MDFDFSFAGPSDDRTFYFAVRDDHVNDPNFRYRYKEPIITYSGKNGNKTTFFENSEYYAEAIKLPSEYFAKYIGGRLSCPYKFDNDKKCQTFKGEYDYNDVKKYFLEFIKIYKICEPCDYPECILKLDDKKKLVKHCESCGRDVFVSYKSNDKAFDYIEKRTKTNPKSNLA
jgi:translation initiation factor 2 beta subunit (eIF-2beta)/eIF-5